MSGDWTLAVEVGFTATGVATVQQGATALNSAIRTAGQGMHLLTLEEVRARETAQQLNSEIKRLEAQARLNEARAGSKQYANALARIQEQTRKAAEETQRLARYAHEATKGITAMAAFERIKMGAGMIRAAAQTAMGMAQAFWDAAEAGGALTGSEAWADFSRGTEEAAGGLQVWASEMVSNSGLLYSLQEAMQSLMQVYAENQEAIDKGVIASLEALGAAVEVTAKAFGPLAEAMSGFIALGDELGSTVAGVAASLYSLAQAMYGGVIYAAYSYLAGETAGAIAGGTGDKGAGLERIARLQREAMLKKDLEQIAKKGEEDNKALLAERKEAEALLARELESRTRAAARAMEQDEKWAKSREDKRNKEIEQVQRLRHELSAWEKLADGGLIYQRDWGVLGQVEGLLGPLQNLEQEFAGFVHQLTGLRDALTGLGDLPGAMRGTVRTWGPGLAGGGGMLRPVSGEDVAGFAAFATPGQDVATGQGVWGAGLGDVLTEKADALTLAYQGVAEVIGTELVAAYERANDAAARNAALGVGAAQAFGDAWVAGLDGVVNSGQSFRDAMLGQIGTIWGQLSAGFLAWATAEGNLLAGNPFGAVAASVALGAIGVALKALVGRGGGKTTGTGTGSTRGTSVVNFARPLPAKDVERQTTNTYIFQVDGVDLGRIVMKGANASKRYKSGVVLDAALVAQGRRGF